MIPYNRQYIDTQDTKFVSKVLKEDLITTGKCVKKFEELISKNLNVKFSLSCSSGTSALHLALMSIKIKADDVVIMPAINFVAVYSLSKLLNAKVYLADVNPLTGQMTPETLVKCIKKYKLKKIKAIITMYLGGYPESIREFYNIKKKLNCFLIEDACHALGARYFYNGRYFSIGSCKHSDICIFSLHPVKTITTGEGGIATTNSKILYQRMMYLRSHGIQRNKKFYWKYNIQMPGFNYRLSDINCALGISQFKKINKFIRYRKNIFDIYRFNLKKISSIINFPLYKKNKPSYHLFLISINFKRIKCSKDKFLNYLKNNHIFCQYHYIPIYRFSFFKKKIDLNFYKGAEYYYENTLSLPIFYNLKARDLRKIINKIKFFLKLKNL